MTYVNFSTRCWTVRFGADSFRVLSGAPDWSQSALDFRGEESFGNPSRLRFLGKNGVYGHQSLTGGSAQKGGPFSLHVNIDGGLGKETMRPR